MEIPNEERRFFFDLYDEVNSSSNARTTIETRYCRYCSLPNPTFLQHAHLVPELLGINKTINYYECDKCNSLGSIIEKDFASFLDLRRVILRTRAKNGWPKIDFSREQGRGSMQFINNQVLLNTTYRSKDSIVALTNDSIRIRYLTRKLKPFNIFKIFLKLFIGLLPEDSFAANQHLKALWQSDCPNFYTSYFKLFRMELGNKGFAEPVCYLFKVKNDGLLCDNYSEYSLILGYGNLVFQFVPPITSNFLNLADLCKPTNIELYPYFVMSDSMPVPLKDDLVSFNINIEEIDTSITSKVKFIDIVSLRMQNKELLLV